MSLTEGGKCNRIYRKRVTQFAVVLHGSKPASPLHPQLEQASAFILYISPPPHLST
jgi:hypothetical protein